MAPIKSVRSDVGDTWFVTMDSEDDALNTILALRGKTFEGKAIKARLKSENLLRSFFPVPTAAEVQPTAAAAASGPYGLGGMGGGGPGGAGGGMAGGGMPYGMMNGMGGPMMTGQQPNYGFPGPGARGGMYGRGSMMMQQQGGAGGGMRFGGGMQQQHAGMVQQGGGRGGGMMQGGRGGMQMGGMGGMHQGQHGMGQQMMGMNAKHPQQVTGGSGSLMV